MLAEAVDAIESGVQSDRSGSFFSQIISVFNIISR
jgi:hypothetical protein